MSEDASRAVPHPVAGGRLDLAANLATFGLALAWLVRLVPQALAARLQTDECFHAWVSRWIAAHGTLPARIDGLYGGFGYFYPPLFHVLGACAFRSGGLDGFRLLNVVIAAALLGVVAAGAARLAGNVAARWAVCVCVAGGFLAEHAVRLYVEALSALLAAAAAFMLARVLREARIRDGAALGVLAGLAITAKLTGLVLPPIIVLLAAGYALRGHAAVARALGVAAAVALVVAAPLFVRNALLFGSPIYPALGRDVHPLVMALNVRHFTPAAFALYAETLRRAGPATLACVAAAFALAAWTRRAGSELAIAAGAIALVLLAPLQPLVDARHLLPLVIVCGTLSAVSIACALEGRIRARRAVDLLALAFAAWAVLAMPHWRTQEDLDESPGMLEAFTTIRANVPATDTLLARETYDTFWYADRPANWPIPFGQHHTPIEMFQTANPDSVESALRAHHLTWILLTDDPVNGPFNGADWPEDFITALQSLATRGRAKKVWSNDDASLWRLEER